MAPVFHDLHTVLDELGPGGSVAKRPETARRSSKQWSTSCVKVVELDINQWPINQLRSHCILPEDLVVGHPYTTAEQAINGKFLHPDCELSSIQRLGFLGADVRMIRPSNNSWGSGSVTAMFFNRSSLRSTDLPATIWLTNLAGIGE